MKTIASIWMHFVMLTLLQMFPARSGSSIQAADACRCDTPASVQTPSDREILSRKISLNLQNVPLSEVLQQIAKAADVKLQVDTDAFKEAQINLDRINNVSITNIELQTVLTMVLWKQQPFFAAVHTEVCDGVLVVTTWSARNARLKQKLPEWLQAIYDNHKIQVELDRDHQIISLQVYRPLTDELLGQISTLSKLRSFEINGGAEFTATGAAAFAKLVSLETLKVTSSPAPTDLPALWDLVMEKLSDVESLRGLELSEAGISDEGIAAACRREQLTSMRLYQEGRLTDVALESIASQTHMKRLDLTSYVGTPLGRMHFSQEATRLLKDLEELEHLSLPGHDFSSDLFDFSKLQSLHISGSRFQAADAANIARCPQLFSLDLSYSHIDDDVFKWLADHPKLSRLQIRSRGITDNAFAPLKRVSKLKHIHLWTSGLTDRSLEHFAAMTSLAHLSLNWGTNSFTTEGIMGLADSDGLKSLELRIIPMSGGFIGGINIKEPDAKAAVTIVLPPQGTRPQLSDYERERSPFNVDHVVDALPKVQVTVTQDEFFGGK